MAKKKRTTPSTFATPADAALIDRNYERQRHLAQLEQRLKEPAWHVLVEYTRKKLGDPITLWLDELMPLIHPTTRPVRSQFAWTCSATYLVAVLMVRYDPKIARNRLDDLIDARRPKRKRRSQSKHERWRHWRAIGKSWQEIQHQHQQETGEVVTIRAITKAVNGK